MQQKVAGLVTGRDLVRKEQGAFPELTFCREVLDGESGVALRLPPQSMTRSGCQRFMVLMRVLSARDRQPHF